MKKPRTSRERRPTKLPAFFSLSRQGWLGLYKLLRWVEDTPESVTLPDRTWEAICHQLRCAIPDIQLPRDYVVVDVILVKRPENRGTIVALVDGCRGETYTEHHVPVLWTVPD
jgi:hypothetical protein